MTDDVRNPNAGDDEEQVVLTAEECAFRSELLAAARKLDQPASGLQRRIADQLAPVAERGGLIRRFLAARREAKVAVLSLAACAVGGLAILLLRSPGADESIAPELAAPAPAPEPSAVRLADDPCAKRYRAAGRAPLLDDFEDGDGMSHAAEGRARPWLLHFDYDKEGEVLRVPSPKLRTDQRKGNRYALHLTGGRLQDWGTSADLTFEPHHCYDASAYAGLQFWGKGPGRVLLGAREVRVIPRKYGGSCDDEQECFKPHSKTIDLGAGWTAHRVRWSELRQRGEGKPPFNPTSLHSIEFHIPAESTPFDIWIDDVAFIQK